MSYVPAMSPRPPAEGREQSCNEENIGKHLEYKASVGFLNMTKEHRLKYQGEVGDGQVSPRVEQSTPSYLRWAQHLHNLLEDQDGVDLYESYLKQEKCETNTLTFWFACQGLKKAEVDIDARISAIYRSYIKSSKIRLDPETKKIISHKIGTKTDIDQTIYNQAQLEIEETVLNATYLNFLKSDVYLQHVQKMESDPNSNASANISASRENLSQLPTLHEDSEFVIEQTRIGQSYFRDRQRARCVEPVRVGAVHHNGFNKRFYRMQNPSHIRYSGFQPTSAQDSELQSLSSDAQTDDTLSVTDTSSIDSSYGSRHYYKKQQRDIRRMAHQNNDLQLHQTVIPRTQRVRADPPLHPQQFFDILTTKLLRVKQERDCEERMKMSLRKIESEDRQGKIQLLQAALGGKVSATDDSDQSILDEHVSRVWDDSTHQTPNRSPGCRSPMHCSFSPPDRRRAPVSAICGTYPGPHNNYASSFQRSAPCCQQNAESRNVSHSNTLNRVRRDKEQHWNRELEHQSLRPIQNEHQLSRKAKTNSFVPSSKKTVTDSCSSCVDSGVSVSDPLPSSTYDKVYSWVLENDKYSPVNENAHSSISSSSPASSSRHSNPKKPLSYNASRHGSLDPGGSTPWPGQVIPQSLTPSQPVARDPSMPILPPPDTNTQLEEAKRRLEIEAARGKSSKTKLSSLGKDKQSEDSSHRKSGKKSAGASAVVELTIIHYSYAGETLPYRTKLAGKNITLKQFKALLTKKGNFRYFFKTTYQDFGEGGVVKEEITDDNEVLPLWEDRIYAIIEPIPTH